MFALERALIAQMRPVAMCCAKDTLPKLPVPSTLSILKSFRLQGGRLLDVLFSCNGKAAHVEHHRHKGAAVKSVSQHLKSFLALLLAWLHRQLCFDLLSDTTSLEGCTPKMQVKLV